MVQLSAAWLSVCLCLLWPCLGSFVIAWGYHKNIFSLHLVQESFLIDDDGTFSSFLYHLQFVWASPELVTGRSCNGLGASVHKSGEKGSDHERKAQWNKSSLDSSIIVLFVSLQCCY